MEQTVSGESHLTVLTGAQVFRALQDTAARLTEAVNSLMKQL